jgi:hypothetical protein
MGLARLAALLAALVFAGGPLLDDPDAHIHWQGSDAYRHTHDHLAAHDHEPLDDHAADHDHGTDHDRAPVPDRGHGSRRESHAYLHAGPAPALAAAPALDLPRPQRLAAALLDAARPRHRPALLAPSAAPRAPPA